MENRFSGFFGVLNTAVTFKSWRIGFAMCVCTVDMACVKSAPRCGLEDRGIVAVRNSERCVVSAFARQLMPVRYHRYLQNKSLRG